MAYLHCHSCNWSQDDFWSLKYNPITKFWNDIVWLYKPRWMSLDDWIINDLIRYTKVPIKLKKIHSPRKETKVFSWNWLLLEFVKEFKIFLEQRWWTWKSWNKARKNAVCPKCKNRNFDID